MDLSFGSMTKSHSETFDLRKEDESVLNSILEGQFQYKAPNFDELTRSVKLRKLARTLSEVLKSSLKAPLNYSTSQSVDLGIRYLLNEALNEQKSVIIEDYQKGNIAMENKSQEDEYSAILNSPKVKSLQNDVERLRVENATLRSKLERQKKQHESYKKTTDDQIVSLIKSLDEDAKTIKKLQDTSSTQKVIDENDSLKDRISKLEEENISLKEQIQKLQESQNQSKSQQSSASIITFANTERSSASSSHYSSPQKDIQSSDDDTRSMKEALENINKLDMELNDIEKENEKYNQLTKRFQEAYEYENELLEEGAKLANTHKEVKKLLKRGDSVKYVLDQIKTKIGYEGALYELPEHINMYDPKIEEENTNKDELIEQLKQITGGLVAFIQNILEGNDCSEETYNTGFSLENDEKTKDMMRKAIEKALDITSDKEELPLFEASIGSKLATQTILKYISNKRNSSLFTVVALLSAVNGRLIELLSENKNKLSLLSKFFPNVEEKSLPHAIFRFMRDIQPLVSHCRTILETFYKVKLSNTNQFDILNLFIDNTQTLVSNIETELKVLIPYSTSVSFDQIPAEVRKQYEEEKKKAHNSMLTTINNDTIQDQIRIKKLKGEVEALQRVISSLKEENKSVNAKNKQLRESVDKLTIFNNELEKTASNLKERAESIEIKLNSQIDTNNMLKNVIHQRDEQYEKRTQQILRNERARHDNDLKRAQEIYSKQRTIYESKVARLMEKRVQ